MELVFASLYSPDDDVEHAIRVVPESEHNAQHPFAFDTTFSPHLRNDPADSFNLQQSIVQYLGPSPLNILESTPSSENSAIRAITAAYSPVDRVRYLIYATNDNKLWVTGFVAGFGPGLTAPYAPQYSSYPGCQLISDDLMTGYPQVVLSTLPPSLVTMTDKCTSWF
jgi:hypothetical protein